MENRPKIDIESEDWLGTSQTGSKRRFLYFSILNNFRDFLIKIVSKRHLKKTNGINKVILDDGLVLQDFDGAIHFGYVLI